MRAEDAKKEMVEGYLDGLDADSPEPSDNRSRSYRHGFANGRRDRGLRPINTTAYEQRRLAAEAIAEDCYI